MNRRRGRLAAFAAGIAGLGAMLVAPAAMAAEGDPILTVREIDATDRAAVEVTFLWTGGAGQVEKDLTVREDGDQKDVSELVTLESTDQRVGTVVAVDLSGSMNDDGALSSAKAGILALAEDLRDGDQLAVVSFNDQVAIESAFTSDVDQITTALDSMAAPRNARTSLFDGLQKAASMFENRPDLQPNILLVTDGGDEVSRADEGSARASVVSSGAALFAVELTHAEQVDRAVTQRIIDRTGGAVFAGGDEAGVQKAFADAANVMSSQYVVTYPSDVEQGSVTTSLAIGSIEHEATYVAGGKAQGAATAVLEAEPKAFGPSWIRSGTGAIVALVLVGLAVGLGVYAFVSLVTKEDDGLQAMLRPYEEGGLLEAPEDGSLAQTALLQRAVEITEDLAQRQGFLQKVEQSLERADLPLRAAEAIFFYFAAVVLLGIGGFFLFGTSTGLILAVLLVLLPPAALKFLAARRAKAFVGQLPDTLQLLSGSLRAGYSLLQGIEAVSQEVAEPMGKELRRVVTEARLGREAEDAMDAVAERMGSPDFAWAVMAVRIQREVGGNLSELLLTVAETMVQRDRLRRDVSALTAEGRMSAIILGLLPIGLGAFMWMSNPEYMSPLKETGMGQAMVIAAVVSILIGFAWMKKTITIEI